MPRANSKRRSDRDGSSRGRRSAGDRRDGSFKKSSGKSEDRPFKKSFSAKSGDKPFRKSSSGRDEKPFKKSFTGKSSERPFKKSAPGRDGDRPFKKSFSRNSDEKPFRKSSSERSGDKSFKKSAGRRDDDRPFKKSFSRNSDEKPFRKSSSERAGDKPFKRSSDRRDDARPFKKSFSRDSDEKPFRKSSERSGDKPFKKSFSRDSDEKPFRKSDEGSGSENRRASQKSNPNYSRPFKRKSFDKRAEEDAAEKHGFFSKDKTPGRGSRRKFADASEQGPQQDKLVRLNKYIANSGVCSRREADELITMGLISVNGKVITELGYKVNPGDEVRHENRVLRAEKPVYILMNKPKGYLTTTDDPQERNTVMHIIGGAVKERIYPVGRLDRNTTGLLLFTNDGDLADKLMHPSYNVKKIYKVELDRPLTRADFERLQEGVHLEEGKAQVDDVAIISEDGKTVGLEIHIGWNRVVRRIFEALDYAVVKLDRSVYAGLDKKDLSRGHWRFLTKEEIVRLKHYK
jgi:23S rRNA pseudouridine2605 synthase